jgi:ferrous iron transport protein B
VSAAPTLTGLQTRRVALVGSPNAGKTTLFNGLTGGREKVANYPGVTVDCHIGPLRGCETPVDLIDLPGTYRLDGETPDEKLVASALAGQLAGERPPDALLVVADATSLPRGLGLVAEILALGRPTALVLTMVDEVAARGGLLDVDKLARILGIRVLGVVGNRGVGLDQVRALLADPAQWSVPLVLPQIDTPERRFAWVDAVLDQILTRAPGGDARTDRIDAILLHPLWGSLVFLAVMIALFQSIFTWAAPAMDWIDGGMSAAIATLHETLPPGLLTDLLTDGILAGVGSVLVFLPQIVILFALIHALEDVGYMARAAFVVDRVMGFVGLQGRCFVSLLSSYACAIPGIMAARTIVSPRDRLATILVAPFMTCSARLPVYTLLIAAFIPAVPVLGPIGLQGLVLFGLYALGTLTALGSALLLNSTLLRGTLSRFYLELPPYRRPTARLLGGQIWESAASFMRRAGTRILAASLLVWMLIAFPRADVNPELPEQVQAQAQIEQSGAARVGKAIEPVIAPLGFDWRIGVGLVSSLIAREVIIATLGQIYAVEGGDDFDGLRSALVSDVDPQTGRAHLTLPAALALLVFFVFALQCTSTMVVMARETGSWRWPIFAFVYMLAFAYAGAFITYRLALALGG